jgi:hypothetical protein
MRCKIIRSAAAVVASVCVAAATVPRALAVCYWNEPGNFCQCAGYGYGPGYHAPLILGPPDHCAWFSSNEVRWAFPPGPPNYCGYGWACGCGESDQSLLEPTAAPVSQPQPTPASAAAWSSIVR